MKEELKDKDGAAKTEPEKSDGADKTAPEDKKADTPDAGELKKQLDTAKKDLSGKDKKISEYSNQLKTLGDQVAELKTFQEEVKNKGLSSEDKLKKAEEKLENIARRDKFRSNLKENELNPDDFASFETLDINPTEFATNIKKIISGQVEKGTTAGIEAYKNEIKAKGTYTTPTNTDKKKANKEGADSFTAGTGIDTSQLK